MSIIVSLPLILLKDKFHQCIHCKEISHITYLLHKTPFLFLIENDRATLSLNKHIYNYMLVCVIHVKHMLP